MPCFVNLPLSWVHEQPAWVDWFVNGRIAPELGLDAESLALPDSWHRGIAKRFAAAGLCCAVHLPFWDVDPTHPDADRAVLAGDSLRRGAALAGIYSARHMVGHPYYRTDSGEKEPGVWLEKSRSLWPQLPRIAGAPLFLENTYETSPDAIATLALLLQGEGTGGPGIGVCFDIGHWHSFAGKKTPAEMDPWLDAFSPFSLHLHLHDNDGSSDMHLGLGVGTVPFDALLEKLAIRQKDVTATLEPHDAKAFALSIAWLTAHDAVARRLGWETPNMDALPLTEIEEAIAKG